MKLNCYITKTVFDLLFSTIFHRYSVLIAWGSVVLLRLWYYLIQNCPSLVDMHQANQQDEVKYFSLCPVFRLSYPLGHVQRGAPSTLTTAGLLSGGETAMFKLISQTL